MELRCIIVDDSPGFVEAASSLLTREGVAVVGMADNLSGALERVAELRPRAALVDIDLGGESGFEVARRIAQQATTTDVILISTHSKDDFADLVAESPAAGFISKSELSAQAIRQLLDVDA